MTKARAFPRWPAAPVPERVGRRAERGWLAALLAWTVVSAAAALSAPARAADDAEAPTQASAQTSALAQTPASVPAPASAPARPDGSGQIRLARQSGALLLSAQLDFVLPSSVQDVLAKGVPVYFIAEADIVRPRWYWTDQRLGQARRYWRLSYLPLTRRWRLASSSESLPEEGIGTGLAQHYGSLGDAVAALQRITGWRIADEGALAGGGQQTLIFSFRLDTAQLPRALQIGMAGQADWRLRIERRIDLTQEVTQDAAP